MSRLVYPNISLDYHPGELARVVSSEFEPNGSGSFEDYFPDIPIPIGHYASMWHAIEAYLDLRYTTGRFATVMEIYRADRLERTKAMARGRKDAKEALFAEYGFNPEHWAKVPQALRESVFGADFCEKLYKIKPQVKRDRRKKLSQTQTTQAGRDIQVLQGETKEQALLRLEADRLIELEAKRKGQLELSAMRAETNNDSFEILDYTLADT